MAKVSGAIRAEETLERSGVRHRTRTARPRTFQKIIRSRTSPGAARPGPDWSPGVQLLVARTPHLRTRNATAPADWFGYSPKTAPEQSSRPLSKCHGEGICRRAGRENRARIGGYGRKDNGRVRQGSCLADIRQEWSNGAPTCGDPRSVRRRQYHRLHLGRRRHQLRRDRRDAAFISEIAETREGVRMAHSKVDALHKLGLELGMFKQGREGRRRRRQPPVALVQSIPGSALPPLGFQQPQAPAAPVAADPRIFIATNRR